MDVAEKCPHLADHYSAVLSIHNRRQPSQTEIGVGERIFTYLSFFFLVVEELNYLTACKRAVRIWSEQIGASDWEQTLF